MARKRLPKQVEKAEEERELLPNVGSGRATVGELMAVYLKRSKANSELAAGSITARETGLKKVQKTWPGIQNLKPKQITPGDVQEWVARFKKNGTNFTPKGAKKPLKGNSASSVNRAIDTLRRVLDIALERRQISINPVTVKPADGRLKKKLTKKKFYPPSRAEVDRILEALKSGGQRGGWGVEAYFLCSFLLMSGARIGEARKAIWKHVDWQGEEIWLDGYKTDAAPRFIPLFAELGQMLKALIEWREATAKYQIDGQNQLEPGDSVFKIGECQKSLDAACVRAKARRLTHHDFRHIFATTAIENGIDFKTIADWLGHSDGGVLVMTTYGHVRKDHSRESAKKMRFRATAS